MNVIANALQAHNSQRIRLCFSLEQIQRSIFSSFCQWNFVICQTFPRLLPLFHFSLHWLPSSPSTLVSASFSLVFSFISFFYFASLHLFLPSFLFRCSVSLLFPVLSLKLKISWRDVKLAFHWFSRKNPQRTARNAILSCSVRLFVSRFVGRLTTRFDLATIRCDPIKRLKQIRPVGPKVGRSNARVAW